jgi:CRP-like cAMP-binding protein
MSKQPPDKSVIKISPRVWGQPLSGVHSTFNASPQLMFDTLRAYFAARMPITDEQFAFITALFTPRPLRKGDFLLREGEVATHGAFVAKGCLRNYVIDNKGKEHIVQFAPENWWMSNLESMSKGTASLYFIDAIEDSDLLLITKPAFEQLMTSVAGFSHVFQAGLQKSGAAKEKRIIASLSATAEERYNDFLSTYPPIAQRVPQHILASYLGITPETLSRIRKKQSLKK